MVSVQSGDYSSFRMVRGRHSLEGFCKHETLHVIRVIVFFFGDVVNARDPSFDYGSRHPRDKHLPSLLLPLSISSQAVPRTSVVDHWHDSAAYCKDTHM
jgi:hypothetical protein